MTAMKKKMVIIEVWVIAFVTSYIFCGTEQNDAGIDSIKIEEYTAALSNKIDLDLVVGTYCGILPPNVETTLTLIADGAYLLIRTFKEKQNEQERLKGSFQVLDGNILMLVHPLSGDNILQGEGCYFVNIIYFTSLTDFTVPLGLVLNSRAWLFASGIE